jgi:hypothetical protein
VYAPARRPRRLEHERQVGADLPEGALPHRSRLFAEWADQTILVIGTHFAAPTAASSATAQRSGLRCEGGEPHPSAVDAIHLGSRPKTPLVRFASQGRKKLIADEMTACGGQLSSVSSRMSMLMACTRSVRRSRT